MADVVPVRIGNILMNDIFMKVVAEATSREIVALVRAVILTKMEIRGIISAFAPAAEVFWREPAARVYKVYYAQPRRD
jgi:hypothetical protein